MFETNKKCLFRSSWQKNAPLNVFVRTTRCGGVGGVGINVERMMLWLEFCSRQDNSGGVVFTDIDSLYPLFHLQLHSWKESGQISVRYFGALFLLLLVRFILKANSARYNRIKMITIPDRTDQHAWWHTSRIGVFLSRRLLSGRREIFRIWILHSGWWWWWPGYQTRF